MDTEAKTEVSPSATVSAAASALGDYAALQYRVELIVQLFTEEMKPVNAKAQRKVPLPEGIDLDAWINPEEERHFLAQEEAVEAE